jgi:hypothetical protein
VADTLVATIQINCSFYSGWEVMTGSLNSTGAYDNWVNGYKTQVRIVDQSPRLENLAITLHQQWKTKLYLNGSYAKQQLTRWKKRGHLVYSRVHLTNNCIIILTSYDTMLHGTCVFVTYAFKYGIESSWSLPILLWKRTESTFYTETSNLYGFHFLSMTGWY